MEETQAFTAEQAAKANFELRNALGLQPESFSTQQFVGMISEEIEQLRSAGRTDEQISQLLADRVGVRVSVDSLRRFYSDEAERTGYP